MNEYYTNIRLPNGKRSEIGRLGLCVTIDNEPECFEFTNEDLEQALELVKRNVKEFNADKDGSYNLQLFFADKHETNWIDGTQLGIAETFVMKDFMKLSGLK